MKLSKSDLYPVVGLGMLVLIGAAFAQLHRPPPPPHIVDLCEIAETDGIIASTGFTRKGEIEVWDVLLPSVNEIWPVGWRVPCSWLNRKPRI